MKKVFIFIICSILLTSFVLGNHPYKGKHQGNNQQINETIVLPQTDVNKEITKDPTNLSPKPPEEIENTEAWWVWYSYCQMRLHNYFVDRINKLWQ